jgi:hypothetical protein
VKYQPATKSLILDAEKIAHDLRYISGRAPAAPEGWNRRDAEQRMHNYSMWVSNTLTNLYKAVKHLIPSRRGPYWNQVNAAVERWNNAYGRRNWQEMSVAYDRVLEAVYAAEEREGE